MLKMKMITLKKGEEKRILAGHCWVYSNEIDTSKTPLKQFSPGELVQVASSKNQILGVGYINPNTLLCVRLLSRNAAQKIDKLFISEKIATALTMREKFFPKPFYRLVYSEADQLPGLIVDRHGNYLVMQLTTAGMEQLKHIIIDALIELLAPQGILIKNSSSMRILEGLPCYVEVAYKDVPETITIEENDVAFKIPGVNGQKTGWFYDHRANRAAVLPLVKNKSVLDLFSYVGGFGIQAAVNHAKHATCIDSSPLAIEYINLNAELNSVTKKISAIKTDVTEFLSSTNKQQFDIVMLDPPALIKKAKDLNAGSNTYLKLNRLALKVLSPGGILLSSSCSMHLKRDLLLDIIRKAGVMENKKLAIVQQLHQAADHPIHPAIKETEYLKGFMVICNN